MGEKKRPHIFLDVEQVVLEEAKKMRAALYIQTYVPMTEIIIFDHKTKSSNNVKS